MSLAYSSTMRAVVINQFGEMPRVTSVPDPRCSASGVLVEVKATGLCRSDWHGWMGHDSDIQLPHVPGHELAGVIREIGRDVSGWSVGDRVTTPFVCACGVCPTCLRGDQQVCDNQSQPGFSGWGSYAELVALEHAETNLIGMPDAMEFDIAASLGCRFATAYRAVAQLAGPIADEWVVVHGCGGVGLSAVMIAVAHGARVIAVDPARSSRELAASLGAVQMIDGLDPALVETIRDVTRGGAAVSIDALGSADIVQNSLAVLRKRGRHIQIGLLAAESNVSVAMDVVIGSELQLLGSHGMAAHTYPAMLAEIASGVLRPDLLIRDTISLDETPARLAALGRSGGGAGGITIIRP